MRECVFEEKERVLLDRVGAREQSPFHLQVHFRRSQKWQTSGLFHQSTDSFVHKLRKECPLFTHAYTKWKEAEGKVWQKCQTEKTRRMKSKFLVYMTACVVTTPPLLYLPALCLASRPEIEIEHRRKKTEKKQKYKKQNHKENLIIKQCIVNGVELGLQNAFSY